MARNCLSSRLRFSRMEFGELNPSWNCAATLVRAAEVVNYRFPNHLNSRYHNHRSEWLEGVAMANPHSPNRQVSRFRFLYFPPARIHERRIWKEEIPFGYFRRRSD